MKKVAVFGKPGSGKSTLSKRLAAESGIKLYQLDSIEFDLNGERVSAEVFNTAHQQILEQDKWVIDGLGFLNSFKARLEAADTLIYIDLPYLTSYWLVTKRLLKGMFIWPEGWPQGSSLLKGTLQSYKMLKVSPKFWNKEFTENLKQLQQDKSIYVIGSVKELNQFMERYPEIQKSQL